MIWYYTMITISIIISIIDKLIMLICNSIMILFYYIRLIDIFESWMKIYKFLKMNLVALYLQEIMIFQCCLQDQGIIRQDPGQEAIVRLIYLISSLYQKNVIGKKTVVAGGGAGSPSASSVQSTMESNKRSSVRRRGVSEQRRTRNTSSYDEDEDDDEDEEDPVDDDNEISTRNNAIDQSTLHNNTNNNNNNNNTLNYPPRSVDNQKSKI